MRRRVLDWLRRHPFAVEAYFDRSVVLTYAFPEGRLRRYLPECLGLDTYGDEHAFVAVAAVQTRDLRPRGFPRLIGRDFLLMGYRIFVRYRNEEGRRLRGLYILRSETDRKSMEFLGNLFTRYRYTRTDVSLRDDRERTTVCSRPAGLRVTVDRTPDDGLPLPQGSPFTAWRDARRFAGPLPFTFSVDVETRRIVIIEGVRTNWVPRPVRVLEHRVPFVDSLTDCTPMLASAFMTERIPYRWKKGVVERWTP